MPDRVLLYPSHKKRRLCHNGSDTFILVREVSLWEKYFSYWQVVLLLLALPFFGVITRTSVPHLLLTTVVAFKKIGKTCVVIYPKASKKQKLWALVPSPPENPTCTKNPEPLRPGFFSSADVVIRRLRQDFVRPYARKSARTAGPLQKESREAPRAGAATTHRAA